MHPSGSEFFYFHAVFGQNLENNRLAHPTLEAGDTPTPRKILDPPLLLFRVSQKCTKFLRPMLELFILF